LFSSLLGFFFSLPILRKAMVNQVFFMVNENKFFYIALFFWSYTQLSILLSLSQYFDLSNPTMTKDLVTDAFFQSEGLGFEETGKGFSTIINTLFYILGFPSLILGAVFFSKKRIIGLMPLVLGCMTSLISFSRFHMFIYFSIFIFSYFIFKKVNNEKINFKKNSMYVLFFLIALFGVPAYLRSGASDLNIVEYFAVYIFGGFAAFKNWLDLNFSNLFFLGNLNGTSFYSLKTWISYLGIANPPSSLHYEFFSLNLDDTTNVYSLFRPLFEDFGIVFSSILIFCFCLISGFIFRMTYYYKRLEFLPLLVFLLTFTVFMFYTSIFSDFRVFLGSIYSVFVFKKIFIRKIIIVTN
jgi:oligosaccharide repeat unit polymerase